MSVAAALVLSVPGTLLLALGALWFRAPGRLLHGVLDWAARHTHKEPSPPAGATRAARALGGVLVLTGSLLLVRAALYLA